MARKHQISKPQKSKKHKKLKQCNAASSIFKGRHPCTDSLSNPKQKKSQRKPVNSKPSSTSEQDIPYKVLELQKLMVTKDNVKRKRKRYNDGGGMDNYGATKRSREPPVFKQNKHESASSFYKRMVKVSQDAVQRAHFEERWGVEIQEQKGNKVFVKPAASISVQANNTNTQTRKSKKRPAKKVRKSSKHQKNEFDEFKDNVKFGEVVNQPPVITAKPRQAQIQAKPGCKALLLNKVMRENVSSGGLTGQKLFSKSVKRKAMSLSEQRQFDEEREHVINQYRKQRKWRELP